MTTQNNQVSALQATVAVVVGLLMVGKAVVEIYSVIARMAYRLGRYVGKNYYGSKHYNPMVSEVTEAVSTEAAVIKEAAGTYLCGWVLFASSIHALYLYIRRFDYVASVEWEEKVRKFTVDNAEKYGKQYVRAFSIM